MLCGATAAQPTLSDRQSHEIVGVAGGTRVSTSVHATCAGLEDCTTYKTHRKDRVRAQQFQLSEW